MAPRVGFEPTTNRLTADCSTAELPRISEGAGLIALGACRCKPPPLRPSGHQRRPVAAKPVRPDIGHAELETCGGLHLVDDAVQGGGGWRQGRRQQGAGGAPRRHRRRGRRAAPARWWTPGGTRSWPGRGHRSPPSSRCGRPHRRRRNGYPGPPADPPPSATWLKAVALIRGALSRVAGLRVSAWVKSFRVAGSTLPIAARPEARRNAEVETVLGRIGTALAGS